MGVSGWMDRWMHGWYGRRLMPEPPLKLQPHCSMCRTSHRQVSAGQLRSLSRQLVRCQKPQQPRAAVPGLENQPGQKAPPSLSSPCSVRPEICPLKVWHTLALQPRCFAQPDSYQAAAPRGLCFEIHVQQ